MEKLDFKRISIVGVALVVLIMIILFVRKGQTTNNTVTPSKTISGKAKEESIPTVDPTVQVNLKPLNLKREVELIINSIPSGTNSIDYELSYDTEEQGLQGVIGQIEIDHNKNNITKKIMLGTSSSGVNIYHKVVGGIRVYLRFTGSFGEKVFEKNFDLD